jgi:hypothetical protein
MDVKALFWEDILMPGSTEYEACPGRTGSLTTAYDPNDTLAHGPNGSLPKGAIHRLDCADTIPCPEPGGQQ